MQEDYKTAQCFTAHSQFASSDSANLCTQKPSKQNWKNCTSSRNTQHFDWEQGIGLVSKFSKFLSLHFYNKLLDCSVLHLHLQKT